MLGHLPPRLAVLRRLTASLKPGGWIVAEDMDFASVTADEDQRGGRAFNQSMTTSNEVLRDRSPIDNGVHLDTLCAIDKEDMEAESLERPALDVTPDGDRDLYLSCATYGSRHWRIERLRARRPQDFSARTRATVFPGSAAFSIKDPVLVRGGDLRISATLHPLTEGEENADQMVSVDACSGEPVMVPEPGTWYRRGTRLTAVVGGYAYFDGRASAAENFEERTGIAKWDGSRYVAVAGPVSSPFGGGALRYVSAIELPAGRLRLYSGFLSKF